MNFLQEIAPGAHRWLRASLRGLDWWLSVRWRALLTWAACTVLAVGEFPLAFGEPNAPARHVFAILSALLPAPLSAWMAPTAWRGAQTLILFGFAPIILRLGMWRILLWWTIATVATQLYVNYGMSFGFGGYFTLLIALGIVRVGLPALVMIGRRTRPWVALIAAAIYGGAHYVIIQNIYRFPSLIDWEVPIAFTIAGAVLIYGTSLLSRPPAETPGVGDEPPSGAEEASSGGEGTPSVRPGS